MVGSPDTPSANDCHAETWDLGPDSSAGGPLGPVLPATFGRYTLLERVGGGGMATVYRASLAGAGGFEKDVAVKVIRQELSEESQFTAMFLDEARLSARLNHANVVQTFDFGQHEGVHFIAMELVRGRTLAATLRICAAKGTRLGLAPSLHVAAEVAKGLGYAHRLSGASGEPLGIVHRDVSPQNVLISREGEVKLADFGIAKAVNRSHVTQPGRVRGKCAYMAPEQIRGEDLDGRADVFALGIVLWECLTCRPLFEGDSDAAVLMQVLEKELPPPSAFAPDVPPAVDDLVLRLLARDRRERPDSTAAARELADLTLRLIRSQADIDLAELQRRLGSGTAVYRPPAILPQGRVAESPAERTTAPRPAQRIASVDISIDRAFDTPDPGAETVDRSPSPKPLASPAALDDETIDHRAAPAAAPKARVRRIYVAGAAAAIVSGAGAGWWLLREPAAVDPDAQPPIVDAPREPFGSPAAAPRDPASVTAEAPRDAPSSNEEALRDPPPMKEEAPRDPPHVTDEPARQPESMAALPTLEPAGFVAPRPREVSAPRKAERSAPPIVGQGQLVLATRLPNRSSVRIDGRSAIALGPSPTSISVPAGTRKLRIEREGGASCTVTVRIDADRKRTLLIEADAVTELDGTSRKPLRCN